MSNRSQAQYLRIYSGNTNYQLLQSYYSNSSITLGGLTYEYCPFNCDGLIQSTASGGNAISLTIPATEKNIDIFTLCISRERLIELKVYEFDSRLSQVTPESSQTLIVSFLGLATNISGDFNTLSIDIDSSLSAVGVFAPPRKFTNFLIGNPIKI